MKKLFVTAMLSAAMLSPALAQTPAATTEASQPASGAQSDTVAVAAPTSPAPATVAPERSMAWIGFLGGVVLILVGGMIIYRRSKGGKASADAPAPRVSPQAAPAPAMPTAPPPPAAAPVPQWNGPAGFDSSAFLRDAKASFIRMQAAWDKADTADLQKFTTAQVFDELAAQIQGRGQTADVTEVVSIDAELLGMETIGGDYLASVKFTGMIKSAPAAPAEPFAEVWNMARPVEGGGDWLLAGIQQLS